MSAQSKQK